MSRPRDPALIETMSLGNGPLRLVVKDSIDIAGHPTRQASAIFADAPAAPAMPKWFHNFWPAGAGPSPARPICMNWLLV
jgi:hypothetical protein